MKVGQRFAALTFALLMLSAGIAQAAGFKDVPTSHPNYTAIAGLQSRGIIGGYPDGTFKPDQAVNRVEALKIILGAAGVEIPTDSAMGLAGFSDVDGGQWYAPYLRKALSLGVVEGYPDGTFKPTQTVNLVENLKILLNAKGVNTSLKPSTDPYVDAPKDQWYAGFVLYAKNSHLIDADAAGKIYPAQGMTRAKLAEVAYRLIYNQENQLDIYPPQNDPGESDYILSVNIKNMAFNKNSMTIGLGSTVRWTNADTMTHSVINDSGTELMSAVLANGDTYTHTFNKLGTYTYHCGVHPSMKGTIIVKPAIEVPTI